MPITNNWVVSRARKPKAAARLLCVPYAGGSGSVFHGWPDTIHSDIEAGWVQWPGSQNRIRETPFPSLQQLIPALVDGISDWLDRPFAIYGHSLGAKIAFETVRELRRRGGPLPCSLFVGASHAPQIPWPHPILHHLPEELFVEGLQRSYGGIPRQILEDRELRALLIPSLRADIRLIETYHYTAAAPLDCPVVAFGGAADGTVTRSALEAWQEQTRGPFQLRILEGDHFFLQTSRIELLNAIENEFGWNAITVG